MGTTTFTGPIKSGPILNTSGTTIGKDIKNVGSVVLAQSALITNDAGSPVATNIIIPANSQIVEITITATEEWPQPPAVTDLALYVVLNNTFPIFIAVASSLPAWGVTNAYPTDETSSNGWANIDGDYQIFYSIGDPAGGAGILTVRYIQNTGE